MSPADTNHRLIIVSVGSSLFSVRNLSPASGVGYAERLQAIVHEHGQAGLAAALHTPTPTQERLEEEIVQKIVAGEPGRRGAELDTLLSMPEAPGSTDRIQLLLPETIEAVVAARVIVQTISLMTGSSAGVNLIAGLQLDNRTDLHKRGLPELVRTVARLIAARAVGAGSVILVVTGGFKPTIIFMTLAGLFYGADVVYQPEAGGGPALTLPRIRIEPDTRLWMRHRLLFDHADRYGDAAVPMMRELWANGLPAEIEPYLATADDGISLTALGQLLHEQAKLRYLDPLTKLLRRDAFSAQEGSLEQLREVGFILFDVDHFKQINDRLGHDAGDMVLREVAARATNALQEAWASGFMLRWGGEEFLAVLPLAERSIVRAAAENIRARIGGSEVLLAVGAVAVRVTAGVSSWPADGAGFAAAITSADERLYVGKREGRNRVVD